jgi:hypothetical protein
MSGFSFFIDRYAGRIPFNDAQYPAMLSNHQTSLNGMRPAYISANPSIREFPVSQPAGTAEADLLSLQNGNYPPDERQANRYEKVQLLFT